MLSFWEINSFSSFDFVVVGSGIVGLSTAIEIKEKKHDARVLVLERGLLPTGASTKNAGFACFGSATELLVDIEKMGKENAFALVTQRWSGLQKLRQRLGDENIGFKGYGGYELIREKELYCLNQLDSLNQWLLPLFKEPVFIENKEVIKEFGFGENAVKTAIFNKFEGQIDTGMMMRSLLKLARAKDVEVWTGAEVVMLQEEANHVALQIKNPVSQQTFEMKAGKVAICTNAFTRKLLPDINLQPGRGQVLVTDPIPGLKFKGVFHFDEGYFYFRNFGDQVIFGGGRNLDFDKEASTVFDLNEQIQQALEENLKEIILPTQTFKIQHRWAGIMAFGPDKQPVVKQVSDKIVAGVRLGGMGVAIGSNLGEQLANILL